VHFHPASDSGARDLQRLQQALRRRALRLFPRRGLLQETTLENMLTWQAAGGFSLDASVRIAGHDRAGRERLLRYCARPPFALERLRIERVHSVRSAGGAGAENAAAGDIIMSYVNIMTHYAPANARRWDAVAQVPYLSHESPAGPAGCSFVSYEDQESIRAKGALVRELGLGGAMVWTTAQGHVGTAPAAEPVIPCCGPPGRP